jgi:serine/threonine protein kinase
MEPELIVDLHRKLNNDLNIEGLKTLCFALQVDFENLSGDGKEGKIRELILHLQRQGRIDALLKRIKPDAQSVTISERNQKPTALICSETPKLLRRVLEGEGYVCEQLRAFEASHEEFNSHIERILERESTFLIIYLTCKTLIGRDGNLYLSFSDTNIERPKRNGLGVEDFLSEALKNSIAPGVFLILNLVCDSDSKYQEIKSKIEELLAREEEALDIPHHFVVMNVEVYETRKFDDNFLEVLQSNNFDKINLDWLAKELSIELSLGVQRAKTFYLSGKTDKTTTKDFKELSIGEKWFFNKVENFKEDLFYICTTCKEIFEQPLDESSGDYGLGHSRRVLDRLSEIIDRVDLVNQANGIDALREEEIFIVAASAYLHCVGKQISKHSFKANRNDYHIIGHKVLQGLERGENRTELFGLVNVAWCKPLTEVKEIIKLHRDDQLLAWRGDYEEGSRINLLASILRVADVLDSDYRRHREVDKNSLYKSDYHCAVRNFVFRHVHQIEVDYEKGEIGLCYIVPNEHFKTHLHLFVSNYIRNALKPIKEILSPCGISLTDIKVGTPEENEDIKMPGRIYEEMYEEVVNEFRHSIYLQAQAIGLPDQYYHYTSSYTSPIDIANREKISSLLLLLETLEEFPSEDPSNLALKTMGFNSLDYLTMASLYTLIDDTDKALLSYERAIEKYSASKVYPNILAKAYYGLHQLLITRLTSSRDFEKDNLQKRILDCYEEAVKRDHQLAVLPRNQYEIIRVIGRGGVGIVYQVRQLESSDMLAAKVLHLATLSNPKTVNLLQQEAKALQQLDYPNIVHMKGLYLAGRRFPCILMEYVEGNNLQHLIKTRKLSPTKTFSILAQICNALAYAHNNKVIHRDIKPSNIVIDQNTVKVIDFGLAKVMIDPILPLPSRSVSTTAFGTPGHMAPELWDPDQKEQWNISLGTYQNAIREFDDGMSTSSVVVIERHLKAFFEVSEEADREILINQLSINKFGDLIEIIHRDKDKALNLLIDEEMMKFVEICDFRLKQLLDVYSLGNMAERMLKETGWKYTELAGILISRWIAKAKEWNPPQRTKDIPKFVSDLVETLHSQAYFFEQKAEFDAAVELWDCLESACKDLDQQLFIGTITTTAEQVAEFRKQGQSNKLRVTKLLEELNSLSQDHTSDANALDVALGIEDLVPNDVETMAKIRQVRTQAISGLRHERDRRDSELKESQIRIKDIEHQLKQFNVLSVERADLRLQLEQEQLKATHLAEENEKLTERLSSVDTKLKERDSELQESQSRIRNFEEQLQRTSLSITESTRLRQQLEQEQQKAADLSQEIGRLTIRRRELRDVAPAPPADIPQDIAGKIALVLALVTIAVIVLAALWLSQDSM